jgi:DNA-binding beta-propeller fold protein YncE
MIIGLYDSNLVMWGTSAANSITVTSPVQAAIDSTGRVYIAEGISSGARVLRYHQDSPGTAVPVADQLTGPQGIAVDPVGDIYVIEQGAGRVVLVSFDGTLYQWTSGLVDPQYMAFTQY